jgi:hypothetical protein
MAPEKALMGIEPCPLAKNSLLFTIVSSPFGEDIKHTYYISYMPYVNNYDHK